MQTWGKTMRDSILSLNSISRDGELKMHANPRRVCECGNVECGRLLGLVSRAVFKTAERLLESLVCSIRTAFRQPPRARGEARNILRRDIYLRHALLAGGFALFFYVRLTRRRD